MISIIHQIWYQGKESIPEKYDSFMKSFQHWNPTFEFRLWSEKEMLELLLNDYAWFLPIWNSYEKMIQKIDAIKYFILDKYGGFYVDLDLECCQSLSQLFMEKDYSLILCESGSLLRHLLLKLKNPQFILNYNNQFLYSIPNHVFIQYCIYQLSNRIHKSFELFPDDIGFRIMYTAGPMFLSDMVSQKKKSLENWCSVSSLLLDAKPEEKNEKTILVHHSEANWFPNMKPVEKMLTFTTIEVQNLILLCIVFILLFLFFVTFIIIIFKKNKLSIHDLQHMCNRIDNK